MSPFVETSRFSKGNDPKFPKKCIFYIIQVKLVSTALFVLWSVSQDIFYGMDVSHTGSLSLNELTNAFKVTGNFTFS